METRVRGIALSAVVLALVVVVLGSYVRLSDAGLACPDWPGCYGHVIVPVGEAQKIRAAEMFPAQTVMPAGAWKEMIHRYAAGLLGLAVLALAWLAFRHPAPLRLRAMVLLVAAVVTLQALLGMWTVTLQLRPAVVMLHLLGGMAVLGLLWWLGLGRLAQRGRFDPAALAVLSVLVIQMALGGWTSANYAATACTGFPGCNGAWWPPSMDWAGIFSLDGALPPTARVALQWLHRLMALVAVTAVLLLACRLWQQRRHAPAGGAVAAVLTVAVLAQFTIGAANVLTERPLALAVAHNAGAAVLLLAVLAALHLGRPPEPARAQFYGEKRGG